MAATECAAESKTSRAIREFLAFCRMEKGLSRNSLDAYSLDLYDFQTYADPLTGGDFPDTAVLKDWVNHLYGQDLSSRSIARHLSAIRGFFHFLVGEGKVAIDPTEDLCSPKQWSTLPKFLNREQIEKLIAAPDCGKPTGLRDRAMLELLYATGIRVTELIQLRMSNLDTGLGLIRVTGKGNKQRIVPVHATALQAVGEYVSIGRPQLLGERGLAVPVCDRARRTDDPAGILGLCQGKRKEGRHFS